MGKARFSGGHVKLFYRLVATFYVVIKLLQFMPPGSNHRYSSPSINKVEFSILDVNRMEIELNQHYWEDLNLGHLKTSFVQL